MFEKFQHSLDCLVVALSSGGSAGFAAVATLALNNMRRNKPVPKLNFWLLSASVGALNGAATVGVVKLLAPIVDMETCFTIGFAAGSITTALTIGVPTVWMMVVSRVLRNSGSPEAKEWEFLQEEYARRLGVQHLSKEGSQSALLAPKKKTQEEGQGMKEDMAESGKG